jgi:hypothetical protein
MPKDTMYYIGDLEVWFNGERTKSMEMAQTDERYIKSLFATGHVLKDVNGKGCLVNEIVHPANRV